LTGGDDQTLKFWEVKAPSVRLSHQGAVRALAVTAGHKVMTGSHDRRGRVWGLTTGRGGERFGDGKMVSCVGLRPDGRRTVAGTYGGPNTTAQIWDVGTGRPIGRPLPHEWWVWSVGFSPDGRKVVTADGKGRAWLWDSATGNPVGGPFRHKSGVYSAVFS